VPPGRAPTPQPPSFPGAPSPEVPWGTAPSPCARQAPLSLCSALQMVLEGEKKHLLSICFKRVFWLPPKEDMQGLDTSLYQKVSAG